MPRKAFLVVLIFLALAMCAEAGMPFLRKNRDGERLGGFFPESGDVEDLVRIGKVLTYRNEKFQELYGSAGNRYIQYGMVNLMSANYDYGGSDRRVSLEIVTMENPTGATGLFHHHRARVLRNKVEAVEVGAEGIIDTGRGKRNLYFYRGIYFVKIVYSGDEPVPSLMPIAEYVDKNLPAGRDDKPAGFKYIEIEGINKNTIQLTPGFTFNIAFMPASVTASAPGGGSPASDLYVITRFNYRDAAEVYRNYTAYLRLHADYIEEYKRNGIAFTKGKDPNQGRVVFAAYKDAVIIAARPDGYEKGEALIDRVMARIDGREGLADSDGPDGGDDGDSDEKASAKGKGKRWNPFRKRN